MLSLILLHETFLKDLINAPWMEVGISFERYLFSSGKWEGGVESADVYMIK